MAWNVHDTHLVTVAALAMGAIVLLVSVGKVHPFVALVASSTALGLAAGLPPEKTIGAFQKGVGETLGSVGVVIALGAMLGKLLEVSGSADRIVSRLVDRAPRWAVPWVMALAAMAIGLPMFFEVGVVLLMPIVVVVARKTGWSNLRVGLPALAGLSVLHGLVPPHPAPLAAASLLNADVGRTLVEGLVVAIPTVIIAGPLFGGWVGMWVEGAPHDPAGDASAGEGRPKSAAGSPSFGASITTLLLPVALMMLRAAADVAAPKGRLREASDFVGHAAIALLIGVLVAMITCGLRRGLDSRQVGAAMGASLAPVAAIVMIVGAGGGFKETLVESGVGDAIGKAAAGSALPPLLLAWLIAVGIRVATGSATVATVTASGIMAPLEAVLRPVDPSLLTLAIGCGSLFFSHVNDAGFWLVKEYFGLSVTETLASWSAMEAVISIAGLGCVLALGALR